MVDTEATFAWEQYNGPIASTVEIAAEFIRQRPVFTAVELYGYLCESFGVEPADNPLAGDSPDDFIRRAIRVAEGQGAIALHRREHNGEVFYAPETLLPSDTVLEAFQEPNARITTELARLRGDRSVIPKSELAVYLDVHSANAKEVLAALLAGGLLTQTVDGYALSALETGTGDYFEPFDPRHPASMELLAEWRAEIIETCGAQGVDRGFTKEERALAGQILHRLSYETARHEGVSPAVFIEAHRHHHDYAMMRQVEAVVRRLRLRKCITSHVVSGGVRLRLTERFLQHPDLPKRPHSMLSSIDQELKLPFDPEDDEAI